MKVLFLILFMFVLVNCSHSKPAVKVEETTGESSNHEQGADESGSDEATLEEKTYRFAIISDMNSSYGSKSYGNDVKRAVEYISSESEKFDFVISTGDMVAGQKSGLDYNGMWNSFHSHVTRPLHAKNIPVFPSPGNHDAHISRSTERNHYKNSWNGEDPFSKTSKVKFVDGVSQNFPFQYAFTVGSALFVSIDNTSTQPWAETTVEWLKSVFEVTKELKFKFVYGHVPMLPFAFTKETEYFSRGSVSFLRDIEDLFETYKVNVFFSGHSHVYYPGRRDAFTEYISVPLLGSGSRYLITRGAREGYSPKGYLVVEYSNKGSWEVEARLSGNNSVIDDLNLPEFVDLPSSNSSLCSSCTSFPSSHFLDSSKRIIYRRSDL